MSWFTADDSDFLSVVAIALGTPGAAPLRQQAFEHFEIAAYKSLLALCGPAGADGARALLEQSLKEEEAMAAWVDQNVGKVTIAYLNREERAAA
jgi:ferritin-like metal-binding protein YciE